MWFIPHMLQFTLTSPQKKKTLNAPKYLLLVTQGRRGKVDLATASKNLSRVSTSPAWTKENTLGTSFFFSPGPVISLMGVQRLRHPDALCQETFPRPLQRAHTTHSSAQSDCFDYFITACCVCPAAVGALRWRQPSRKGRSVMKRLAAEICSQEQQVQRR